MLTAVFDGTENTISFNTTYNKCKGSSPFTGQLQLRMSDGKRANLDIQRNQVYRDPLQNKEVVFPHIKLLAIRKLACPREG